MVPPLLTETEPLTAGSPDAGAFGDRAVVAPLRVHTLGGFRVWRDGLEVDAAAWGRDKAVQLFQFLVTQRRRRLSKEQIVDQLWPASDPEAADRDFKVALNAVQRALEPERPPRAEPRFIRRFGPAYGLDLAETWVDAAALEAEVAAGNQALPGRPDAAIAHFRAAATLYDGDYLPERRYEDWASFETERLQTLALGAMTRLAAMMIAENPLESLHLSQRVLAIDPVWEDAWRIHMQAHLALGNRALALRAWQRCVDVMEREIGLAPLPATRAVYEQILAGAD
jgi:DNA-binding SARP family transcriptional activator